ncbi:MAG: hypothetical protein B7Z78_13805 [Rhodospirillales bacterium 20-60-12]|nr:MAG: hypothetical protein B7Z78_13805 [Rhodospirillales bacterium 20-60-12]
MTLLTTLADVSLYIGATDTSEDQVITALIANASAFIESFCNRTFAITAYTETRNGNNRPRMMLNNSPITAISSLAIDAVTIPLSTGPTVPGYTFDLNSIYLRPGGSYNTFRRDVQNVQVSYSAGFSSVPSDVAQACIELVAFKRAKRSRIDKKNETLGSQQTIGFDTSDMPASVKTTLMPYQRFTVF